MKVKKPVKVEHLANWYFGNFCARCGNVDDKDKNYGKDCWDKLQLFKEKIRGEMTHKEFARLIRNNTTFCKPVKRKFHHSAIQKML